MCCIHCGKALPDSAKFCYSCGTRQVLSVGDGSEGVPQLITPSLLSASMKCPHCKLDNPPEAIRCDCGYNFLTQSMSAPVEKRLASDRRGELNVAPMFCIHCGKTLPESARFCSSCGHGQKPAAGGVDGGASRARRSEIRMSLNACPACQAPVSSKASACPKCGHPVSASFDLPSGSAFSSSPVSDTSDAVSPKRRLTALLLWLFLGLGGGHRFYVGKWGTALVYWMLLVIAFSGLALPLTAFWIMDLVLITSGRFRDKQKRRLLIWS